MVGHLIRNQHLLLTVDKNNLSCSIIARSQGHAPYELAAYQRYTLAHHEIMQLRFYNISKISQYIGAFIKAHHAHHAFVSCALNGPGITQLIMRSPEPSISATMLLQQSPDPLIWDSCYLYPTDHALHTFYACGIPRELLLQYQILTRMSGINMSTLTSAWYAHLKLYTHMQGPAFRRVNLAHALGNHNHAWNNILNRDMLARMITIPAHYKGDEELPFIKTALGLFIIGTSHG
jgi:hypothetical protein